MNLKKFFKFLSTISLILFYVVILIGIFAVTAESFYLWKPNSAFTKSFGNYEPIFSYLDITFFQQPELYSEKSFIALSLVTTASGLLLAALFLWFMHKLLKNVSTHSLFMYENASILLKLGVIVIILGTTFEFTGGLLQSKALNILDVSNAKIGYVNLFYIDTILTGVVLIIIATALKKAVHAVEENRHTI